ncbi:hypothetical protein ASAP_2236 [Asaia bogorensis]|uniref:Uncharacterized protein n=1 Tax=Asaia bogorensis TaxID=91915 RepID=A0A060QKX9_9PROT|nr:hypothetical protein ASAP_2236 [Asaia bogorensis]
MPGIPATAVTRLLEESPIAHSAFQAASLNHDSAGLPVS